MSKKPTILLYLLVLLSLVLGACATPTAAPTEPAAPVATEAPAEPAATEPPAAATEEALAPVAGDKRIILATTTSTEDSGLLEVILPDFTAQTGIEVDVIAVGTGQALQLGIDGNADVLLVHARAREDEFMTNGDGVRREEVMYNDFVIVGPAADPAGIKGMTSANEIMKKIADTGSTFISRGDDSGTHTKELSVWKAAGIEPADDWYVSAGQGMGDVLNMAKEQLAYTLSDRATYLALVKEGLDLVILGEGDPVLFNPYGVIAVNPDKNDQIQNDLANQFIDWIISVPTQELIGQFGVADFGAPLFIPNSELYNASKSAQTGGKIILATTTSTEDSGLLEVILPDFTAQTGIEVDVIAVGTGQALQLGVDGNADVLLVHARAREDEFMTNGDGVRREEVMYNDFVIVGPAADPAGIKGMRNVSNALKKLADSGATFISRGDDSGTHTKELSVWKAAGIEEPSGDWYVSAGQGMGDVLNMAKEQLAYTLSDRATYLALVKEGLDLEIVVEGDAVLFNPYGVIAVNPEKNAQIRNDLANIFIDWIISVPTQELIGQFGVADFGAPLFIPNSELYNAAQAANAPAAALKVTGKVTTEMAWTEEEVKAMETMEATAPNSKGVDETYTGVSINALLALAGLDPAATAITLVADDGYSVDVPLADLQACANCILSFRSNGGFSSVMPGFDKSFGVKGVVEIVVK